jgi:hypothetical protein
LPTANTPPAYDFGFAFAGEGSATLSGFDFAGGMMITIR